MLRNIVKLRKEGRMKKTAMKKVVPELLLAFYSWEMNFMYSVVFSFKKNFLEDGSLRKFCGLPFWKFKCHCPLV